MSNLYYTWEGVCNHYNDRLYRNIVDTIRIWISCDDINNLQNLVRDLPTKDIIIAQDYKMDDEDGEDVSYNCEVWIKDIDRIRCLKYLDDNNYTLI